MEETENLAWKGEIYFSTVMGIFTLGVMSMLCV